MTGFLEILAFVLVSGFLGLMGGFLLLRNMKLAHKISFAMVAFAVGALLATAFLDLLPEALKGGNIELASIGVLAGILVFFFIEKFLIWHHHHTYGENEEHEYKALIIIGDSIHNFIDGIILAAAFLVSPQIGIPAFIAVILHEVPQEISDFAILMKAGMKKRKIIAFNILSALFAVVGAAIAYMFITSIEGLLTPILSFAAGAFIYIAASDLIPETKKENDMRKSVLQIALVIIGIVIIWYTGSLAHEFIHLE